jgi:hypothetical protein
MKNTGFRQTGTTEAANPEKILGAGSKGAVVDMSAPAKTQVPRTGGSTGYGLSSPGAGILSGH